MTRLTLLLPFAALLGGCIIYDKQGHGRDKEEGGWWDTGDTGRDPGGDWDTKDTGDDPTDDTDGASFAFTLTPSRGEIGTTFIASLTAAGEAFDFATVEGVELYGEADVLATEARPGELLLTISIPASASPGTADLLLLLPEDRVEFIGDALQLVAPGAADGSGADDGSDGSGSDGSGSDGSGSDGSGDSGVCP
ncbi:MAG: hypothetical protein Q8P18_13755 [Pseudomonadota bacterium]|nr:hypothetical protein [Pseudomonadota bacterium]